MTLVPYSSNNNKEWHRKWFLVSGDWGSDVSLSDRRCFVPSVVNNQDVVIWNRQIGISLKKKAEIAILATAKLREGNILTADWMLKSGLVGSPPLSGKFVKQTPQKRKSEDIGYDDDWMKKTMRVMGLSSGSSKPHSFPLKAKASKGKASVPPKDDAKEPVRVLIDYVSKSITPDSVAKVTSNTAARAFDKAATFAYLSAISTLCSRRFALDSLEESSRNVVSLSRSRAEVTDLNAELSTLKKEVAVLKEALNLKDEELSSVKSARESLATRCAHWEAVAGDATRKGYKLAQHEFLLNHSEIDLGFMSFPLDKEEAKWALKKVKVTPLAIQRDDPIGDDATSSSHKSQGEEEEAAREDPLGDSRPLVALKLQSQPQSSEGHKPSSKVLKDFLRDSCPLVSLRSLTQLQSFEGHRPISKALKDFRRDFCPLVALRSQTQLQNFEGHKPSSKALKDFLRDFCPLVALWSQTQLQNFEGHKPSSKALKDFRRDFCPLVALRSQTQLQNFEGHKPSSKALKDFLRDSCPLVALRSLTQLQIFEGTFAKSSSKALKDFLRDFFPLVALRSQTQLQSFEGHRSSSKALKGLLPFGGSKVTNPAPKL
ncbi:hypothetical protein ACOSQ4_025123 [Xanthoceras sorbifolium]